MVSSTLDTHSLGPRSRSARAESFTHFVSHTFYVSPEGMCTTTSLDSCVCLSVTVVISALTELSGFSVTTSVLLMSAALDLRSKLHFESDAACSCFIECIAASSSAMRKPQLSVASRLCDSS